MMKPIILCDVDQVVADLHTEWISRYNSKYDDTLCLEDITSWDFHNHVKPECSFGIYNFLRMPNLYKDVKPLRGARTGVARLRAWGYRVVFVTSCVIGSLDQKARWLKRNEFIPEHSRSARDLIIAKDKSLVRGEVLIDDGPHNVASFPGKTILVDQPYNRDVEHTHRAFGWKDIPVLVADLVPTAMPA